MSQEQVLKTLIGLGLTRLDSEVYIFLAKKGPLKGIELTKGIKSQKQSLYRSLKNLQSKGIVNATMEHPAHFTAVSFDKVVDIFIKTKMAEAQRMQENRNEILAHWQAITIGESAGASAKFNLIEGRGPVYSKILQMMKEAHQLSVITTVEGLLRADQFGLFDAGITNTVKTVIRFRALTELSQENAAVAKKLVNEIAKAKINFEGRTHELSLNLPQLVIKDEEEILFFITPKINGKENGLEDTCLWTNCNSLVQAFTTMFEDFWRNSADINPKIVEIENDKSPPKTCIVNNAILARNKYNQTLDKANHEIIIVTSMQGLTDFCEEKQWIKEWQQKRLSVKIMAPITSKNQQAAQMLQKLFEVRHVQTGYLATTIVDNEHLFQFKNSPLSRQGPTHEQSLTETFYTDNPEYIQKTKVMLNDMWRNAQTPSVITLDSIAGATIASCSNHVVFNASKKMLGHVVTEDEESSMNITEKSVIDKIINARKIPTSTSCSGVVMIYSTNGQAIVHPPEQLGLPDTLFHTYHIEKHSTYGEEDAMMVHIWLNTPGGYAYVPSALITDNPRALGFWRKSLGGTPGSMNVRLVKKDELHTSIHGSTLFVGWTVPIPLLDNLYCIPPSCLLIEGFGNIKTNAYKASLPSGYLLKTEGNILEAFVSYLHPASNYSGPGTDGAFGRDIILELRPPESQKP